LRTVQLYVTDAVEALRRSCLEGGWNLRAA
jgi:hypothetical protein